MVGELSMSLKTVFDAILSFLEDKAPIIHGFVTSEAGMSKIRHSLSVAATLVAAKGGLANDKITTAVDWGAAIVIEISNYLWSQHLTKRNDKITEAVQSDRPITAEQVKAVQEKFGGPAGG